MKGVRAARPPPADALDFVTDNGEASQLIREFNWAATPLGHPSQWSPTLRIMLRFLLANRFPMLLWWGPDYIQFYNDSYSPILGAKHPQQSLGKPVRECWNEVYEVLAPLIDTPFNGGPATWTEDLELVVRRHGFPEESHFTVAYSPVPDDTAPRGIGGVLATVHEITEKVIAERRVKALSDLGAHVVGVQSDAAACLNAIEVLRQFPKDAPFALLYLLDETSSELRLSCSCGLAGAAPATLSLAAPLGDEVAPLMQALATEFTQIVESLTPLLRQAPAGPWPDAPSMMAVVPLKSHLANQPVGLLVMGISACIRLDDRYTRFLELVGSQVATAIANARAYQQERQRAEALTEIDRAKTTFFSNISHEFRTPLTLMLGPLEDAQGTADTPDGLRAPLQMAHRNALRLMKLVNSLLDFARIEAGRVQASFEPVDLAALTADLASTFRSAMQRAGLAFEVNCAPLDEPVCVDRQMWEKIVLNLLSNAFKYTLAGGVRVDLAREGQNAVLSVSDTGSGVPEHELPRLFDRFHRIEGGEARTHEGSGIGLALVQELVKLMGGSIDVRSRSGAGTTFRVSIPFGAAHVPRERLRRATGEVSAGAGAQAYVQEALRWLPDDGAAAVRSAALAGSAASTPDSRFAATFGQRVLIADDNADMRAYLGELLGPFYEVEAVENGAQALAAARRSPPALLLCDVMMPQLDGFQLLQQLRADPALATTLVVLLSARAGQESRIEGLAAGADDYIVKPFHARELLARIGAILELNDVRRRHVNALQDADRQKNEFLAMLAHELRNPLAPIRNASELLTRAMPTGTPRMALDIIDRQLRHLTRLVDDLLDISRITRGRIELRRSVVDLEHVVSQALEAADTLVRQKQHRVVTDLAQQPLLVDGDRDRLVQCVGNILNNAAKYTPIEGEIRIETRAANGMACIDIADSGVGIPAELLPRVFDLFVQGERTLDRSQGGLGVGLAIVRRLIEMHGGTVTASSDGEGRGTVFCIRLPLAQAR